MRTGDHIAWVFLLVAWLIGCEMFVVEGRGVPSDPPVPPEDRAPPDEPPPDDPQPPPDFERPPAEGRGIWISHTEIQQLPMSGPAWEALLEQANAPTTTPNLSDQNQDNNIDVLAKALAYVRTGEERYRTEVRANCVAAIDTELGGRTLALGRELLAYVVAADLVGLEHDEHNAFSAWLQRTLTETLDGRTLQSTHADRPNNWGTHAGASRVAAAVYLGDAAEIQRCAQVFKGWLGDRGSYAGFDYGELSWQADPSRPVGVNPAGATKQGYSVDGAIPDDMRRGCSFQMPPCATSYAWEAMQGAVAQAEILSRQGYDAWEWQDRALLRAVQFLYDLDRQYGGWWASGDDEWQVWLVNAAYGASFPTEIPARSGKNMGWTDWTHGP
jgi:hypothetical protein